MHDWLHEHLDALSSTKKRFQMQWHRRNSELEVRFSHNLEQDELSKYYAQRLSRLIQLLFLVKHEILQRIKDEPLEYLTMILPIKMPIIPCF